jgi:PAS domain-containing protein
VIAADLRTTPRGATPALLSLWLASSVAIACAWQLHALRRRQFLAREAERAARSDVERQLAERRQAEDALRQSEERRRTDITERKRTEERLRATLGSIDEMTPRLTYHVDNSPLAVIEWGPDMRLIRWSGAAERVFGWKAEEV